jgi:predicted O-linked N-acetylglucosamine transferase (SPINDLY family)
LAKISDGCVALWARVLLATPNSRLQLRWKTLVDSGVRQTLRERFASHGVSPGRIEMYGATRHADILAAYGEVDVALDTWPFSGATTTCEALWMGVPVVTLVSDRPAGRQSASILQTLDASDWIAHSEEDFVLRAVACADDHDALVLSRQGLRKKMASTSLGDGRLFAHGFAQTLRRLV